MVVMNSELVDHALLFSRDPWFAEQFPCVRPELQFTDLQSMFRFLDTNENRMVIVLDGKIDGFPNWSANNLVIQFHEYSSGSGSDLYEAGDVALAFSRDVDESFAIVNSIIEQMIV